MQSFILSNLLQKVALETILTLMAKRKGASRAPIEPGESTLERVLLSLRGKPPYRIYVTVKLWDGSTKRIKITGDTKGILRAKGQQKVHDILAQGADGTWSNTNSMRTFIERVATPRVEKARLRENTKIRYRLALNQLTDELGSSNIGNAVRFRSLERALQSIAREHGAESGRQARTVLSKYILDQLIREGLLDANPIRGISIDLGDIKKGTAHADRVAIPDELYDQIVDHLLTREVYRPLPPGTDRRYTSLRRHDLIVALTLLQAGTGLRLSETLALTRADVDVTGETLAVTVGQDISKTHRARTVPILDDRIDAYWRQRLEAMAQNQSTPLIPAPADPGKHWDRQNASKAAARLYTDIGTELESPLAGAMRSHQWRTILNNRAIARGVAPNVRAAFFGHDEAMNQRAYTDLVDVSSMRAALAAG